jgi:type I restriction enzyme S subunit
MNQTIERICGVLFQSWFVDFDPVRAKAARRNPTGMDAETAKLFPSALSEVEGLPVPKGWALQTMYDCAQYINGAAYRDFGFSPDRSGLPVIKIAELKAGVTAQTRFTLTDMGDRYRIDTGDILFSWSGNPDTSIDTFVWTGGPAWLNQHIFKVVTKDRAHKIFVYYLLRRLRPDFAEIARNKQTTGLGHVTVQDMKCLQVVVPPTLLLAAFEKHAGALFDRYFSNLQMSSTLAETRDALLQKLLSGALRAPDFQSEGDGYV